MKRSRLLQQLDARIAAAKTRLEADCLLGQQAVHLARLGHKEALNRILADLHQTYGSRPNVSISIWLHLAEGLAIYFEDMGDAALGKVRRAHALSVAAGIKPLHALTAAWLAHLHFTRHEVEQAAIHLQDSFRLAEADHHAARSRASLIAAEALQAAGCADLAARWRREARAHAVAEGDDATTRALMHNVAWHNMVTWRQALLAGRASPEAQQHALLSAESTGNFCGMTGATSLMPLQPILRAQILSLRGDAAEALALYEEHLPAVLPMAAARLQPSLLADQAWCYAALDRLDEARASAGIAASSVTESTHVDDRAAAHSRLAQVYERLGDAGAQRRHAALASEAWEATAEFQARIGALFEHVGEPLNEHPGGHPSDGEDAAPLTPPFAPILPAHSAAPHRPATAP